jgi:hypothetical protein
VSKVLPFFNVLLSYLNCGMTHIHASIQDDSLAMLDTLLAATPLLVAANADTILCNFLDMISSLKSDSSSERTLTMNLSSRFTSITWRTKVLHRLKGLLSAVAEYKNQEDRKHFGHLARSSENIACLHGKTLLFALFLILFCWTLVNVKYPSFAVTGHVKFIMKNVFVLVCAAIAQ